MGARPAPYWLQALQAGSLAAMRRARTGQLRAPSALPVITAAAALLPAGLGAQEAGPGRPTLSDSAVVSVLTVLPGDRLYNLFGHTVIRVRDPLAGLDAGFNFGTFDFPETLPGGAGFVARFAYGKLDYKLSASGAPLRDVDWYWSNEARPTIEQTLDLTPAQVEALFARLAENARPENATYRYDFFFDNCSTRPRDALEAVLGDDLQVTMADPGKSFRRLLDPYLVANPGVDLAMDVGLGPPADAVATAREALFLPVELTRWLDAATVRDSRGDPRPIVSRTDTLTWGPGAAHKNPAVPWPSILAWAIAVVLIGVTLVDFRSGRGSRRWLDGILFLLVGVAGLVLAFLVFLSLHTVTDRNLHLLWALPTHLVAGAVLLAGRRPRWLPPYMTGTLALAGLFLVGLPFWTQEIPPAVIPPVLAIAGRAAPLAFPAVSRSGSIPSSGERDSPDSQRSQAADARSR